jgi:hypothetical protein
MPLPLAASGRSAAMAEKSLVNELALIDGVPDPPDVVVEPPPDVVADVLDFDELPHATSAMVATTVAHATAARLPDTDIACLPLPLVVPVCRGGGACPPRRRSRYGTSREQGVEVRRRM